MKKIPQQSKKSKTRKLGLRGERERKKERKKEREPTISKDVKNHIEDCCSLERDVARGLASVVRAVDHHCYEKILQCRYSEAAVFHLPKEWVSAPR